MLKRHTFFQAFSIVALITLFSKLLGFIREAIIAAYFGTSIAADMFYVALIIPSTAFTIIASTIQGRVLPLYIEKKESTAGGRKLLQSFSQLFIFVSIILIGLLVVTMPILVNVMAPGFEENEISETIRLALIMLPLLLMMTITAITRVVYHAHESFGIPAYGPLLNNIVVITIIILLYTFSGVYALALGVLIGGLIQLMYQFLFLPDKKVIFFSWDRKNFKQSLELIKPMIPIIIAAIALQLNVIVDRMVASFLEQGSIAALNYSYRLLWIPLSILLMPITTIFYPKLSIAHQEKVKDTYKKLFNNGFFVILLFAVPIMIIMLIESESLVRLIFERGAFDYEATILTKGALFFYSLGLIFFATREYFAQHFYITKQYRVIMFGSIYGVLINIVGSIILAQIIGINGIAFATSLSMLFQSFYYYRYISNKGKIFMGGTTLKTCIAFAVILIITFFTQTLYDELHYFFSILITTLIVITLFYLIMKKDIGLAIKQMKGK